MPATTTLPTETNPMDSTAPVTADQTTETQTVPGIGSTAASIENAAPGAPSITPSQRVINPETDTVEGRVNKIISEDSPLLQNARTQTAQVANSRGLINSSMANQAGEQAVLNTAVQIAAPDAAAYNRAGEVNVGAQNDSQMQILKGAQAQSLADTEAAYKGLLQTSASATSYYTSVSNNITSILNDPATSQATKQALLAGQQSLLQSGLAIIGAIGNVDLGSLLQFNT